MIRVNVYSTPPDGKCGIGIYTEKLIKFILSKAKANDITITINRIHVDVSKKNLIYYLKKAIELSKNCDIAHIQFEYNFVGTFPVTGFYIPIFFSLLKILSLTKGFNIILTMHGVWDSRNPPRRKFIGKIYTKIINWFLINIPHKIIALSENIKDKLICEGCDTRKIVVIPHGSDYPIIIDKRTSKKKIGIDPDKIVVTIFGYIRPSGNIDPKGHDLFLKAAKYFENNDNIIFLVAGAPQSREGEVYFKNTLKPLAGKNVIFYGFVKDEDIPYIFNATDIIILPYRMIGVSGVLNQAMAYKIPTITSDLQYFKQIKKKYDCIELFRLENIHELVQKIAELIDNKSKIKKLKRNMNKYWTENSWDVVVRKHLTLYLNFRRHKT